MPCGEVADIHRAKASRPDAAQEKPGCNSGLDGLASQRLTPQKLPRIAIWPKELL